METDALALLGFEYPFVLSTRLIVPIRAILRVNVPPWRWAIWRKRVSIELFRERCHLNAFAPHTLSYKFT